MAKFLQLNMHRSAACTSETVCVLGADAYIGLLQEPNYYKHSVRGFPSQVKTFYAGNEPRAMISYSRHLNVWTMPNMTTRDICVALWLTGDVKCPEVLIVSAYLDITNPRGGVVPPELIEVIEYADQRTLPLLVGMDSNAHSTVWGSRDTNARGEELEEFILAKQLAIENVGSAPTFVGRGVKTCIDITLSKRIDVVDWYVGSIVNSSDHKPILFKLDIQSSDTVEWVPDLAKADWDLISNAVHMESPIEGIILTSEWMDCQAQTLTNSIHKAIQHLCPHKRVGPGKVKQPFWTDELSDLRASLRRKFNKYRKSQTDEDWEAYLETRRAFRKDLRASKRLAWKEFTSGIKNVKEMADFVRIVQGKRKAEIGLLSQNDTSLTPQGSLEYLLDTQFPGNVEYEEETTDNKEVLWSSCNEAAWITTSKVKWAINSFGPKKAPGPDALKPGILQKLKENVLEKLVVLFQASLLLGYVPRIWRHSKVIFIPKDGKDDYSQPKSFRPITLSSFILKTLERLVLNKIEEEDLRINPINSNQHAFRKGSSCDTALSDMVDNIEKVIYRDQYALGIFLDIAGAFDNLPTESAINGMKRKQIQPMIVEWYAQYLNNRTMETTVKGLTQKRSLTKGTPQGGVLSPVIWNLAFDSLLELFGTGPIQCRGFADDASLLVRGPDPHTLLDIAQQGLLKVQKWGEENKLRFAPKKTVVVLFTKKRKTPYLPKLVLNGQELDFAHTVKYLGVTLDAGLTYGPHIRDKIKKAKGLLFSITKAIGKLWGPSPTLMKWAYTWMVRPVLTYASVIWGHESDKYYLSLQKLQRLALVNFTSVMRSTPTKGLEIAYGVPPIPLYVKQLGLFASLRCKKRNSTQWDGVGLRKHRGHLFKWDALGVDWGTAARGVDLTSSKMIWDKPYVLDDDNIKRADEGFVICRIAGARNGYSGWTYQITDTQGVTTTRYGSLDSCQSDTFAEWVALSHAICTLRFTDGENIMILCSSRTMLRSFRATLCRLKVVGDCVQALTDLAKQRRIWVQKDPDSSRLKALKNLLDLKPRDAWIFVDHGEFLAYPPEDIKSIIQRSMLKSWTREWKLHPECRQTKRFVPEPNLSVSKLLLQRPRKELGTMMQFITGHAQLRYFQSLLLPGELSTCRYCDNEREESWHIVNECPALSGWRQSPDGAQGTSIVLSSTHGVNRLSAFLTESIIGTTRDPISEEQRLLPRRTMQLFNFHIK